MTTKIFSFFGQSNKQANWYGDHKLLDCLNWYEFISDITIMDSYFHAVTDL